MAMLWGFFGPNIDSFGRNPFPIHDGSYWDQDPSHIYVHASDGSTQTYTLNFSSYSVVIPPNPPGTVSLLSSISLPNGTHYGFTYDTGSTGVHDGGLLGVTLPTGGQVSFTFANGYPTSFSYGGSTWNLGYQVVYHGQYPQTTTTLTAPSRFDVATQSYVNDQTVYTSVLGNAPDVQTIQYYSGSSTLLKTVNITYVDPSGGADPYGGFVSTVTTTASTGQSSKVQYFYDAPYAKYPSKIQEWDFGSNTPTRTETFSPQGPYPQTISIYAGDGSGSPIAQTIFGYDEYSSAFCTVPGLSDAGATPGHNAAFNTSYTNRHNVTTISRWVSGSSWITTHKCYNTLGDVTQEVDEAGNHTTYDYSDPDQWADTSCIPAGTLTGGFPKTITNALGWRTQNKYFSCTGLLQSVRDENDLNAGRAGTTYTYDGIGTNTSVTAPSGGQTTHSPHYTVPSIDTGRQIDAGGNWMTSTTLLDGYNRTSQTQLTSDPDGTDYADTTYNYFGKIACQSTPYRSQSDSTYDNDCYNYDALGRRTKLVRSDGSSITTTYGVSATSVCGVNAYPSVTTDEAGNKRQSWTDSFGRLVEVDEQDSGGGLSIATCYQYDVLGNLLNVTQRGGTSVTAQWRTRNYYYDGISRMTSAYNPESSTVTYRYDSDSNCTAQPSYPGELVSVTDGRGIRTCMQHDALRRLTGNTYSDGTTPPVSYFYDQGSYNGLSIANGKGRRTGMSDGTGQTAWSYDADGNALTKRQTIGGVTNAISHVFNLDDSVQSLTSPNGHTYAYTYNHAERPISLVDNAIGATYVQNAHYYAPGQLSSASHGLNQAITESNQFNSRQQPTVISVSGPSETLLSLSYNWVLPGNKNVGIVYQIQNNRDGTGNRSFQYGYDQLNRLTSAGTMPGASTPWSTIYSYDNWGNLYRKSTSGPGEDPVTFTVDAGNHVNGQGGGDTYDGAGNLTFDGVNSLSYDAENHLHPSGGSVTYSYDGDGRRVQTVTGDGTTQFWYDDDGTVISTTGAWQRDYTYFNGKRLAYFAPSSGNQHYYWSDHLGSARVMSNSSGSTIEWEADYFPYGKKQIFNNYLDNFFLFTGDQFDYELGYNYVLAREQSPVLGRFLSPDQPFADQTPGNPQSWNLYTYVRNNPVNKIDPDGHHQECSTTTTVDYSEDHKEATYQVHTDCHEVADPAPEPNILSRIQAAWGRLTLGGDALGPAGRQEIRDFCGWRGQPCYDLYAHFGWIPLLGDRVTPVTLTTKPAIVPDGWIEQPTRKGNGRIYIDPKNPHNRVRVMDDGYMKVQKNGQCCDVNGDPVPSDSPAAHIPVDAPMESPFE